MNIVLISANKLKEPYPVYPLGLDYVAGSLSANHKVRIIDFNEFEDAESIGTAVKAITPDVIGISLRNVDNTDAKDTKYFIEQYQDLIRELRKNSSALIIVGGSAFTIFPLEFMKALDADYGIMGEGERLGLLLNAIQEKKDTSAIPGIISKNSYAVIPEPWDNRIIRNFNSGNSYIHYYLEKGGMLNLQTKRGCSFKCIYCTYPHIEGVRLRLFNPEEIAKTALELQNAGAKYLFITDSALNCSYPHSMEVAKAFVKAGLSIPWGAFFAPTNPPADYYRILADSGLTHAEFGTESMCDNMLASYRKPFKVKDIFTSHDLASRAGVHVAHYLLFGGPGENITTLEKSLKNAEKLSKTIFFIFCGMRIYPHTELYEIAKTEGQISDSNSLLEPVFYQSKAISYNDIIKTIEDHANGRSNWVIGSGGLKISRLLKRMYRHGYTGPLWERLIQ
ncbi:MAG: cobalamin-dependent protein [Spirochaetes bacterium]|nr:cobalamin-dependent protein [Spirochaetota bacterium]